MDSFKKEIALSVAIVALLAVNIGVFPVTLSLGVIIIEAALVLILLVALVGLSFRESAIDERDRYHVLLADRYGYIFGVIALVFAIILENALTGAHSIWLVVVLCGMILAKIAGWVFGRLKK